MSFTRFCERESAYAKHKWATALYYDRVSTSQTLGNAGKTFLLNKNMKNYIPYFYLPETVYDFRISKKRNICERPMYQETYPKVLSKSNEKRRSYSNSYGSVKNAKCLEIWAL